MATIEKRLRNGKTTWRVRYRDPAGRQRSKVFARKVDADRWTAENEVAKSKGAWVDPAAGKITFGEQAERWFNTTASLRPSTRDHYRSWLDRYVLPTFARAPLSNIDALSVREWMANLAESGLAPQSIVHMRAIVKLVLDSAVEAGRLNRNVVVLVKPPKIPENEMLFLDAGQVERLAEAIRPPYGTLIRFAAYTGLRPGEQAGLRVKRLDLLRGTVRVAEAVAYAKSRPYFGPTKGGMLRTVKLPRFVAEELGAYLADRPHGPEDLVFTGPRGGVLRRADFGGDIFKPAVRAAGLPEGLRYYDLRHTAASLMIASGAHIKVVQKQMGHKDATMTLNRYGHLFPGDVDVVLDRLDQTRAAAVEARAAAGGMWPHGGPAVIPLDKHAGQ